MKGYPQESAIIPKFKCIWIHRFDVVDKYSYKQYAGRVLLFKNLDFIFVAIKAVQG